jgi:hypothetical protein
VAVALAIAAPIIMIASHGVLPSLSKYWETEWQPLFILCNAVTSYFFFTLPRWRLAAAALMLLTAFSVTDWPFTHNMFAVVFFAAAYRVMWLSERYPVFLLSERYPVFLLMYGLGIIVMPFSFLWGEIVSIAALSMYHLTVLIRLQQLTNR